MKTIRIMYNEEGKKKEKIIGEWRRVIDVIELTEDSQLIVKQEIGYEVIDNVRDYFILEEQK